MIWYTGSVKRGRDKLVFRKKMRATRMILIMSAPNMREKQNHNPMRWRAHMATTGGETNMKAITKLRDIPMRRSTICSRPEDFTTGVFQ